MTILWFFVALFVLISIHEFGHFIIARLSGVKVLRFSLGFGPILCSWRDKHKTEFALSLVPLGGYVKMLDETQGPVSKEEAPLAFNNQSVWKRIAIVAAGPVFNFLFALFCFWLIFIVGIKTVVPIVGDVAPQSLAQKAGFQPYDVLIQVNEKPISSWAEFQYAFLPLLERKEAVAIAVQSQRSHEKRSLYLPLKDGHFEEEHKDLLTHLGITPWMPKVSLEVASVVDASVAKTAGIKVGDTIKGLNGAMLSDWNELVSFVQKHPNMPITLLVLDKSGALKRVALTLGAVTGKKGRIGFLGIQPKPSDWPKGWLRIYRQEPLTAFFSATKQTAELTASTFILFGRLVTGKLELQALSGPVGIAKSAGKSAHAGFIHYLSFLAFLSVSLGVLNLLPIPLLDGGHLLYYGIEIFRKKPLSIKAQSIGLYFGLVILVGMMCISLFNDLYRLAG